jgi:hypothetical protein
MPAKKRELIEPHKGDKRYIRRDDQGRIKESDDVGRSLAADRRVKAKTVSKPGQGDKGDRAPAKTSGSKKSSTKSSAKKASTKKASASTSTARKSNAKKSPAKKK